MLDALRFVATAVAKKDYVPALTHYRIKDGRVTGFNGTIALSSDIDVDLDIYPNATKLLAAIRACPGTISLNMTPAGKLAVKSGKFKSFVDCLDDQAAMFVEPEGEEIELGADFIGGIKALAPLMGIDASRPWAMGIKVQAGSMYATNNVMLAQYWHGAAIPVDVVIPAAAIEELLRINETPTRVQVGRISHEDAPRSISFWFGEKRWMRTSLVEGGQWPIEKVTELFQTIGGNPIDFPPTFFEDVEKLKPFIGEHGSLYLSPGLIGTSMNDGEGTSIEIEIPGVSEMQAYHQKHLTLLGQVADKIDWSTYPRPCAFFGKDLRGVIIGQRVGS